MIGRPPRTTDCISSAASDVYKGKVWGYDEEVGQILAEFGRAFIGRFDPAIQADLGYKNAERLVTLTTKP